VGVFSELWWVLLLIIVFWIASLLTAMFSLGTFYWIDWDALRQYCSMLVQILTIMLSIVGGISIVVFERLFRESIRIKEKAFGPIKESRMLKYGAYKEYRDEMVKNFTGVSALIIANILLNLVIIIITKTDYHYDAVGYFIIPFVFLIITFITLVDYFRKFGTLNIEEKIKEIEEEMEKKPSEE